MICAKHTVTGTYCQVECVSVSVMSFFLPLSHTFITENIQTVTTLHCGCLKKKTVTRTVEK